MRTMAPREGAAAAHHLRVMGEAGPMAHRRTATTIPDADLPAPIAAPTDQADHPGCVVVTKINADLRPERGDQADRKDHPGCIAVISHVAVPWRVVDRRSEAAHLGLARTSDFVADLQVGHRGCAVTDRPAVLGRRMEIRVATAGLPGRATTPIHVVAQRRHADTADRTEAIVQVVPRTAALRHTQGVNIVVDRRHAVMGAGVAVAIAARKVSCVAAS
jgi:hypothetical protein